MMSLLCVVFQYERNGGVESFAEFLVSLLDTPTKMQLLSDIRSGHTANYRKSNFVRIAGPFSPQLTS